MAGSEAAGLLPNAAAKVGDGASSVSRALAKLREHPDGGIFTSLFKDPDSFLTAAEMLAEIGDCRGRYPARDALAGDAGQAAVAIESGKRKAACFRWGCNKRLRASFSERDALVADAIAVGARPDS
jgi:transposase IS116/IS110/IS902 family protein